MVLGGVLGGEGGLWVPLKGVWGGISVSVWGVLGGSYGCLVGGGGSLGVPRVF